MPLTCSVCRSPSRDEIDKLLVEGQKSLRDIAGRHNVGHMSVQRHKAHLPKQAIEAAGRDRTLQLVSVVDRIISDFESVRQRFSEIADKAAGLSDIDAEISDPCEPVHLRVWGWQHPGHTAPPAGPAPVRN